MSEEPSPPRQAERKQGTERRATPRFTERLLVTFTDSNQLWRSGLTCDIGAGGMRIASRHAVPPGKVLHAEVMVPDFGITRVTLLVEWSQCALPLNDASTNSFGARILDPPDAWQHFCAGLKR